MKKAVPNAKKKGFSLRCLTDRTSRKTGQVWDLERRQMTTNYSSPRNMEKRMLSRKEAAAYMGISVSTVSKLFLTVPDFPAFKAGNGSRGRILIDRQMLDAWIDKNLEKAI